MKPDWRVKHIVFKKREGIPLKCPIFLPEESLRQTLKVVSHTTIAYQVEGSTYSATEFTLRRTGAVKLHDGVPSHLLPLLRKIKMTKFGQTPKFVRHEPFVSYMVFDKRQLSDGFGESHTDSTELQREALLVLGKQYYAFKEIEFPMTRALYGVSSFISDTIDFETTLNCSICLQAHLKEKARSQVRHVEAARTVLPGDDISQVLDLKLSLTSSSQGGPQVCTINLLNLKVELQELVSIRTGKVGSEKDQNEWFLRKQTLLDRPCIDEASNGEEVVEFKVGTGSRSLPREYFCCMLPKIGPTLFADGLSRCYMLKITLEFEINKEPGIFSLSALSEINIAKDIFSFLNRYEPSPFSYVLTGKKDEVFNVVTIQSSKDAQSKPSEFAEHTMKEVAENELVSYHRHRADTFYTDGAVITAGQVGVRFSSPPGHSILSPDALPFRVPEVVTFTPTLQVKEDIIICRVVNASEVFNLHDYEGLIGGYFVESDGFRLWYPVPLHTSPDCRPQWHSDQTLLMSGISIWDVPIPLRLKLDYRSPSFLNSCPGIDIAIPGMPLNELFSLYLELPISYKKASRLGEIVSNFMLDISQLDISIVERFQSGYWGHGHSFERCHRLHSSRHLRFLMWSDFHDLPDEDGVVFPVPLGNCTVPKMDPTFFANDVYREYELRIAMPYFHVCGQFYEQKTLRVSRKIAFPWTDAQ